MTENLNVGVRLRELWNNGAITALFIHLTKQQSSLPSHRKLSRVGQRYGSNGRESESGAGKRAVRMSSIENITERCWST